jgi:hypothetical protein
MEFILRRKKLFTLLFSAFILIGGNTDAASETNKDTTKKKSSKEKASGSTTYKTCEEFISAFKKKYEFAYDYENIQCESASENGASMVLSGNSRRVREGTGNIRISKFFYIPQENIVLYESDRKETSKYQADTFIDLKNVSSMNDTKEITFKGLSAEEKRKVCEKTQRVANQFVAYHDFRITAGYEVAELAGAGNWEIDSFRYRENSCAVSIRVSGVYRGSSYTKVLSCSIATLIKRDDGTYVALTPEIHGCR